METGDIEQAYSVSQQNHDEWIQIWGDEDTYVQAHGEFGTELSQAFDRDRTMVSVTNDRSVAERFAGESEYLIVNGTR